MLERLFLVCAALSLSACITSNDQTQSSDQAPSALLACIDDHVPTYAAGNDAAPDVAKAILGACDRDVDAWREAYCDKDKSSLLVTVVRGYDTHGICLNAFDKFSVSGLVTRVANKVVAYRGNLASLRK